MASDALITDWETANTPEKCARFFSVQIKKIFTYLAKNITNRPGLQKVCELREKFNMACETVYTYEQIIEMTGPTLMKWMDKIETYDEKFFMQTNITTLLTDAVGNDISKAKENVNDEARAIFDKSLTRNMRITIFDALNILLRLYARYVTLTK